MMWTGKELILLKLKRKANPYKKANECLKEDGKYLNLK